MKLEWMGKHRELIEAVIRFANIYARMHKRGTFTNDGITLSAEEIQTIEYILENEERREKMSHIARRLGITPSMFTKLVARLERRGLLEKYHQENNGRDVIVTASPLGQNIYNTFTVQSKAAWRGVLQFLDEIPPENSARFAQSLQQLASLSEPKEIQEQPPTLIKIRSGRHQHK